MTNKVNSIFNKHIHLTGDVTFSTKHDKELVKSWIQECYESECVHSSEISIENYLNIDWCKTFEKLEFDSKDIDIDDGEGDDNCPYDDQIQNWKDGMENKEIKKRKFIKVRIEREPIERVFEIDDSLSISDLQKQKKFENFVTYNLYPSDRWSNEYIELEEVEDIEEEQFPRFVYKDNEGDFCEGVFFEEDGIQSSIYYQSFPSSEDSTQVLDSNINTWGFIQVFLSCPLEKTKELWNKGEIEELKSYFVPESHCREVEVIKKIYDSRNGRVNISIRNREHLEKRYKCGEVSEVLVDNKQ